MAQIYIAQIHMARICTARILSLIHISPLSPKTHPVPHRFNPKLRRLRTISKLHSRAYLISQPNCSDSAPLFSQTHPTSHHFCLKPHQFRTGLPPLPSSKPTRSDSAPLSPKTHPVPHLSLIHIYGFQCWIAPDTCRAHQTRDLRIRIPRFSGRRNMGR